MAKLILHVGPGKCGSSSIQHFFATHNKPCVQNTRYILLDPLEINELNCEKSELSLRHEMKDAIQKAYNLSFNQDVVEAINNAVAFGFEAPGPHESNEVISLLSSKMTQLTKQTSDFLSNLKSYIDSYYLDSNTQLCKQYGLDKTYFAVSERFSKPEILDMILYEGQQRSSNKSAIIRDYRMLSARMIMLCMKLAANTTVDR